MKVLFLCQRVPFPPDRGDRITTYHLLRHMLESGHEVRVGCFAEEARDEASAAELARSVAAICCPRIHPQSRKLMSLRGLLTGNALSVVFFHDRTLERQVQTWLRESPADLIFVYSSNMAAYAMAAADTCRIMQFAELDSDKWAQYARQRRGPGRLIYQREAAKLHAFEQRIAREFDASIVVSQIEKDLFLERIPGVVPFVLPNGVDVQHFTSKGDERRQQHTVIFTGVMDYEPNVNGVQWFLDGCWPRIRHELVDARLLVVGNRPNAQVQAWHGKNGVEVTGWVESTPPWFDSANVAIAPLHMARGVQNKVLEAMSMALPVVSSVRAAQGLGLVPADTLLVTDDAAETTNHVLQLLREPATARAIGARAAAWVRQHFTWASSYRTLDEIMDHARQHAATRRARGLTTLA